jgi:flavin-dependent dehydrogenase
VERSVYDHFWLEKAAQAGADIMPGEKVIGLDTGTNTLTTSSGKTIEAGFIIAADGVHSVIRTILAGEKKLACKRWRRNLCLALEAFIDRKNDFAALDYPILCYGHLKYGYAWIFPNTRRLVVGLGGLIRKNKKTNSIAIFRTFLKNLGMDGSDPIRIRGQVLPYGNFISRPAWENILLVGDAAGLVDPILGEGIYQAHKSAQLAARAVMAAGAQALQTKNENNNHAASIYVKSVNDIMIPDLVWSRRLRLAVYHRLNYLSRYRVVELLESRFDKLAQLVHGVRTYKPPWDKKTSS